MCENYIYNYQYSFQLYKSIENSYNNYIKAYLSQLYFPCSQYGFVQERDWILLCYNKIEKQISYYPVCTKIRCAITNIKLYNTKAHAFVVRRDLISLLKVRHVSQWSLIARLLFEDCHEFQRRDHKI